MEDGTNLSSKTAAEMKHEVKIFANRGPNNVAININKYIAKYDFDIAMKIKKDNDIEEIELLEKNKIIQEQMKEMEENKPDEEQIKLQF